MRRRRQKELRRAGELRSDQLDVPRARGRELILDRAWRSVAGAAIGDRARVVKLHRGVLELEVPEGPWVATLRGLLPALAGRLAAAYPDLGVKKFRLRRAGDTGRIRAEPVQFVTEEAVGARSARRTGEVGPGGGPVTEERLRSVMQRYLKARDASDQKP